MTDTAQDMDADTATLRRRAGAGTVRAGGAWRWLATAPDWAPWAIAVLALVNVLCFVLVASNPLLVQDAWHFLDTFVRHALDGALTLGDFFAKRGGLDHAQPLKKLVLLAELRHFHLDLRFMAVVGVVCAGGCLLVLRWFARGADGALGPARAWAWALMGLALVSLNSSGVWSWPLVAGGFMSTLLMLALMATVWTAVVSGRLWPMVALAVAYDIVSDDRAVISGIAMLLALAWAAWRERGLAACRTYGIESENSTARGQIFDDSPADSGSIGQETARPCFTESGTAQADLQPVLHKPDRLLARRALRAGLILLGILVLVRVGYALGLPDHGGAGMTTAARLSALLREFMDGGWWMWTVIPLASSVAHMGPLAAFFGRDMALSLQIVLGIALALAHVWFWWRALRGPADRASFAAVCLMLIFYALVAGIIYGRVATFGNAYLNQPRYVMAFATGNVALLLMVCSSWRPRVPRRRVRAPALALLCLAALVWQVSVAREAWLTVPYISAYYQNTASQIGQMGRDPAVTPEGCLPVLPLCESTPARRADLIGLLQRHRLNLYAPAFQRTNRLYPDLTREPAKAAR